MNPRRPWSPGDLSTRQRTVSGLRALADYLEANPAVPVAEFGVHYDVHVHQGVPESHARALVDQVAALLGVDVQDDTADGGHYIASKPFDRITYRIIRIPARALELHNARWSYARNITLDDATSSAESARTSRWRHE